MVVSGRYKVGPYDRYKRPNINGYGVKFPPYSGPMSLDLQRDRFGTHLVALSRLIFAPFFGWPFSGCSGP